MTTITPVNSEALLRHILETLPDATITEIRAIHPVFRTMSDDHLGLRIFDLQHRRAPTWGK